MGDVLIARRRYGFSTISNGGAIAVKFSLVTTGCIVALAAPIASVYHDYPTASLVWLLAFIALCPILDGLAVTSLTELRASFQYRTVALAGPLFSLLFAPKWSGLLPPFIVLSMSQTFYFDVSPTIALLKARGFFGAFFAWQVVGFVVAAMAYSMAASLGGAISVAVADLGI
jgi:hypothetical protein